MTLKKPKVLHWTSHAHAKMRQYGLSQARIRRILHSPARIERGIAQDTIAYMQRAGNAKHPYELWTMVSDKDDKRNVVSAWRYPGVTRKGEPLPVEILRELREAV